MRDIQLISQIVTDGQRLYPDRLAVADHGRELTYAQLAGRAAKLSHCLLGRGVPPQSRCLIILPNSVDFVVAHFGIVCGGMVSVPCDYTISRENLDAIIDNCQPEVLITYAGVFARLGLEESAAGVKHIICLDEETGLEALSEEMPEVNVDAENLVSLMYTTGTTGRAKGVMLKHANVMAALKNICEFVGYTQEDREVVTLPLSHNFGLGHVYCNLLCGGAVYVENGLSKVGRVLKALVSFKATGFPGTPMGFGMLIDRYAPALEQMGKNLRFSVINSAPLPPERAAQLQALLPNLDIMVYYGLTEASRSTFISLSQMGPDYYASVGKPMKGVSVELSPHEGQAHGEVVISGPTVSEGYWRNEEETRRVFREGKLYTGDFGRLDDEGNLFITGRLKEVINVGGYKVNPQEVENTLLTFPGIKEAGVCGLDNYKGLSGESVIAAVVVEQAEAFDAEVILGHCVKVLEKFKVPQEVICVEVIPRTNTGKPKRKELALLLEGLLKKGNT